MRNPSKSSVFSQVLDHLYKVKIGGTVDAASLSMLSSSVLASSPYINNQLANFPASLMPMAMASTGAGWLTHRLLEPYRKRHVLSSALNFRSSQPFVRPDLDNQIDGFLLGYTTDTGQPIYVDYETALRHFMILGQSGVGKTVAASSLMFQHIQRGGGLLMIDGKVDKSNQDMLFHMASFCGRQHELLVINPDDPEFSNSYNPLLFGDPDEKADALLQLIPSTESSPGADHYKQSTKTALTTLIAGLQTAKIAYNMIDLTVLLMSTQALEELGRKIVTSRKDSEEAKAFALFLDQFRLPSYDKNAPGQIDAKKLRDVFGGMGGRLYSFGTGNFGKIMNSYTPDLVMYDAIRQNKIVYMALPTMGKETTARNFGKLAIADLRTAIAKLQKLDVADRPNPPFFAFVDEAGAILNESWSRVPEQSRSAGVIFAPATQTVANYQAISEELFQMVCGNAEIKLFFRVGTQASALEAAELIGMKKSIVRGLTDSSSASVSGNLLRDTPDAGVAKADAVGFSEREQEEYIISPDDLKRLEKGECVAVVSGEYLYDLRIPRIEFSDELKKRFGSFRPNRFRNNGILIEGVRWYGADLFKNTEKYLTATLMEQAKQAQAEQDREDSKANKEHDEKVAKIHKKKQKEASGVIDSESDDSFGNE
jgi:intracellular multiplication protein IcmO